MDTYTDESDYVYGEYYSPTANKEKEENLGSEEGKQKTTISRLEMQWAIAIEIGFILTAVLSASSALCLLRVFGGSVVAVSISLIAIVSTSILLVVFWAEMKQSELRLRICFFLLSLSCGLTIATGDAAIDFIRHYWRIVTNFSIASASLLMVILSLALINRFKE
jgi:hypothetical protein